jgi:hypothetical protein
VPNTEPTENRPKMSAVSAEVIASVPDMVAPPMRTMPSSAHG